MSDMGKHTVMNDRSVTVPDNVTDDRQQLARLVHHVFDRATMPDNVTNNFQKAKPELGEYRIVRVERKKDGFYSLESMHYEVEQYSRHFIFWRKWKQLDFFGFPTNAHHYNDGFSVKWFSTPEDARRFIMLLKSEKRVTRTVIE